MAEDSELGLGSCDEPGSGEETDTVDRRKRGFMGPGDHLKEDCIGIHGTALPLVQSYRNTDRDPIRLNYDMIGNKHSLVIIYSVTFHVISRHVILFLTPSRDRVTDLDPCLRRCRCLQLTLQILYVMTETNGQPLTNQLSLLFCLSTQNKTILIKCTKS